MNIENLQEWIDMPLGKVEDFGGYGFIARVPGGWVITNSGNPVFVPEPKKEIHALMERQWRGRKTDDPIITRPCGIGYVTPEQAKVLENQPQTPLNYK